MSAKIDAAPVCVPRLDIDAEEMREHSEEAARLLKALYTFEGGRLDYGQRPPPHRISSR